MNNSYSRMPLAVLLLTLSLVGLGAPPLEADDSWFPLEPGNLWRHHHVAGAGDSMEVTYEIGASGHEELGNGVSFDTWTVEILISGQTAGWIRYGRNNGRTFVLWEREGDRIHGYDPPLLLLTANPTVGDTWRWRGEEYWKEPDQPTRRVASEIDYAVEVEERRTVRAGSFNALRIRETHRNNDVQRVRWYVRGVGRISEIETDRNSTSYEEGLIESRLR